MNDKPKLYKFNIPEDITTYELAVIMKIMFVSMIEAIQGQATDGSNPLEIDNFIYDALPPDLKKYFIEQ